MTATTDVVVIGGGIAGVSIAAELARDRRVTVLDMEATLAFHTTGRSAAMYVETYGGPAIRVLTTASRSYFTATDDLLRPLPMLYVARVGRAEIAREMYRDVSTLVPSARLLDGDAADALQPLLRPGWTETALLEPDAMEIDVHALHQGFVRALRERGGQIATSAGVREAARTGSSWTVTDARGDQWQAPIVVNAAGAWADHVALLFGAAPIGLQALRRSAFMIKAPDTARGPMICDLDDGFYVKPDAGQMLCSPVDETPQEPGDAKPDELEIARAIDEIHDATTLDARHVRSAWAGLRSFVADRTPVVGPDPAVDGLFWCAAQGGYGIQTAPALARTGAALLRDGAVPEDVAALGLVADQLAADRPTLTDQSAVRRRGSAKA